MSSLDLKTTRRMAAGLLLSVLMPAFLGACSMAPVYGGGESAKYDYAFASPGSRLEQIVYEDLAARFGRSANPDALFVEIAVSSSSLQPGAHAIGLEGAITVTRPDPTGASQGTVIYQGTRVATASYDSTSQQLSSTQAANDASERAAHQLAESVRLALLGLPATPGAQIDLPVAATPVPAAGTGVMTTLNAPAATQAGTTMQ